MPATALRTREPVRASSSPLTANVIVATSVFFSLFSNRVISCVLRNWIAFCPLQYQDVSLINPIRRSDPLKPIKRLRIIAMVFAQTYLVSTALREDDLLVSLAPSSLPQHHNTTTPPFTSLGDRGRHVVVSAILRPPPQLRPSPSYSATRV